MSSLMHQFEKIWTYLMGLDLWVAIGTAIFKIVIIVILSFVLVKVSKKVIYRLFTGSDETRSAPIKISKRRENTLKKLMANLVSYVVYLIAIIMILDNVLGFNIGALLAGAGIAGLAIGFGAQNLVRDVISGLFIIFEDQFSVGDYVLVLGVEGTVEEIGIRTTKILGWTGEMHIFPNGDISQVTNYSVHNGVSVVDLNIPYESDLNQAEKTIEEIAENLPKSYDVFLSTPEVFGVQSLEVSHIVIRVIAETEPSYQWEGERIIRREMKEGLYNRGIEIPSPRLVMYSRSEKELAMQGSRE